MLITNEHTLIKPPQKKKTHPECYHCGVECLTDKIAIEDKYFCCEGCKLVYEIINNNGLCDYYSLQSHPGMSRIKPARNDKYAFLDDESISGQLYQFNSGDLAIIALYIPSIHCSSCMWLLEHLGRMDSGIRESRINFTAKEVTVHFYRTKTTLRRIVELLTTIGYEPYICLDNTNPKEIKSYNKKRIIKLGVAGFCFGNIMMMSLPEYLGSKMGIEEQYAHLFRYLNLLLSLPVFFYSATEFYETAWAGLRQKILNIDAPIVLALLVTFSRSIYEILTNSGAGYLDSMSGIVFFMLAGRIVQERTYKSLSFTRDYKSYFPVAVTVSTSTGMEIRELKHLKKGDIVILHHDEIVPADAILLSDNALIDYSFVTGEADPVQVSAGKIVYAGGRQTGEEMTLKVVKPIGTSYLTSLWNHYAFKKDKAANNDRLSVVHILSKYFTLILLILVTGTAAYWYFHDPSKIVNSVSAMLIVACPCALLLSATFTNSNILRIFNLNGLYLRDASVIEQMAGANHIVFDKTGTITNTNNNHITALGHQLTEVEKNIIYTVVRNSNHPNSRAIAAWLGRRDTVVLHSWKEFYGRGLEASCGDVTVRVGSASFAGISSHTDDKATVYININGFVCSLHIEVELRSFVPSLINSLRKKYKLSLLSGDNEKQKDEMTRIFGSNDNLHFGQKPEDKLKYIQTLQEHGEKVVMIGDGLNDAGALQQSNVGITIADDVNNFTPACDAILKVENAGMFQSLVQMANVSGLIIRLSFAISIIYNFVGLYIAMHGQMRPVAAAILMPCSTLSIVILSSGLSNLIAWKKGLRVTS